MTKTKKTAKTQKKSQKLEKKTIKNINKKPETKKEKTEKVVKESLEKKEVKKEKPIKQKKISKSKEIKKTQQLIKQKKHPTFRGRFGKRSIRSRHKAKWNKWRYPKGLDIIRRKEDGHLPNSGYRTPVTIRFLHPSGFREVLIRNVNDLEKVQKNNAIRIASSIGKLKRKIIIQKANEKGVLILNR